MDSKKTNDWKARLKSLWKKIWSPRASGIRMVLLTVIVTLSMLLPAAGVSWDELFEKSGWKNEETEGTEAKTTEVAEAEQLVEEDGKYTSKEEVAAYLHLYGHLPENYISKSKAYKLGWTKSNYLGDVAPGKSIGGGPFQNLDEQLPEAEGREYHECDIDYEGKRRNGKRLVYSNDGLIYYTEDHYNTFEQLY